MTEFGRKLTERCQQAGLRPSTSEAAQLESYFELLVRWSARINLTALPLDGAPDATIDRLFVEPLAAARHLLGSFPRWFDIGSGGGSPAIPLKIVRPAIALTMVESRGRKAAFLREAARVLELQNANVAEARFEAVAAASVGQIDLLTVRAVKVDKHFMALSRATLRTGGKMLLFQTTPIGSVHSEAEFRLLAPIQLTDRPSWLQIAEAI